MSFKIDQDPVTGRWWIYLPDEDGRPLIQADTPTVLEQLLNDVESGIAVRRQKDEQKSLLCHR